MDHIINEIKNITSEFGFESLRPLIDSLENLKEEKLIDIAILGQFKAGKSSFINNLLGKEILPTGVVPVTSVITRIIYSEEAMATCLNNEGLSEVIHLSDLAEYITEEKNPDNRKGIASATIGLREPKFLKGLCINDTPGLGSIYLNNTKTTRDKLADTSIAVVCISAERPLAEADLALIRELKDNSYRLVCQLTKIDLFTEAQLKEIEAYLKRSLEKEMGEEIPVYKYSIFNNSEYYRNNFISGICQPLSDKFDPEFKQIYRYKIRYVAERCLGYLDLARKVSVKSEKERNLLKGRIFDEKLNSTFIQYELNLIATDSKSKIRESVYEILEPYSREIINELIHKFQQEYPAWRGNLYKISRKYEKWLKKELSEKFSLIVQKERPAISELVNNIGSHFGFFTRSLKDRIYENVLLVLGIKLKADDRQPEFRPMKHPDVSIYTAFDTPIDLLWFLFPMFLFRRIFGNYFLKQIPKEISKNIQRLTSNISGIINNETDVLKERTLAYIVNELNTIEKILIGKKSLSGEYQQAAEQLKQQIDRLE